MYEINIIAKVIVFWHLGTKKEPEYASVVEIRAVCRSASEYLLLHGTGAGLHLMTPKSFLKKNYTNSFVESKILCLKNMLKKCRFSN